VRLGFNIISNLAGNYRHHENFRMDDYFSTNSELFHSGLFAANVVLARIECGLMT